MKIISMRTVRRIGTSKTAVSKKGNMRTWQAVYQVKGGA